MKKLKKTKRKRVKWTDNAIWNARLQNRTQDFATHVNPTPTQSAHIQ